MRMRASATSASSVGRGLTEPPPYRATQHKPLENLCSLSTLPSYSARTLPRCIARQCGRSASALCACLPRPRSGQGQRLPHRRVRVLSLAFACGIVSLRWGSPPPPPPEGMSLRRRVIAGRAQVRSQYRAKNSRYSLAHPHKTGYAKNTAKKFPRFMPENKTKTIYIVAIKAGE